MRQKCFILGSTEFGFYSSPFSTWLCATTPRTSAAGGEGEYPNHFDSFLYSNHDVRIKLRRCQGVREPAGQEQAQTCLPSANQTDAWSLQGVRPLSGATRHQLKQPSIIGCAHHNACEIFLKASSALKDLFILIFVNGNRSPQCRSTSCAEYRLLTRRRLLAVRSVNSSFSVLLMERPIYSNG